MADSKLEEVINTIAPTRHPGIPNPPAIGVGVSSDNGDLTTALSQVGQQISQLQSAYQQQADLITANTQAVQSNTSSKGGSVVTTVGGVASSLLGGGLGLLSPLISGIESLFGGSSTPAPLPVYTPPPPVDISGILQAAPSAAQASSASGSTSGSTSPAPAAQAQAPAAGSTSQANSAPQITVNVNAMDSQSFMDRSTDIANAVREAMLNMHPINDVVASL
jgi:hypothetical protein